MPPTAQAFAAKPPRAFRETRISLNDARSAEFNERCKRALKTELATLPPRRLSSKLSDALDISLHQKKEQIKYESYFLHHNLCRFNEGPTVDATPFATLYHAHKDSVPCEGVLVRQTWFRTNVFFCGGYSGYEKLEVLDSATLSPIRPAWYCHMEDVSELLNAANERAEFGHFAFKAPQDLQPIHLARAAVSELFDRLSASAWYPYYSASDRRLIQQMQEVLSVMNVRRSFLWGPDLVRMEEFPSAQSIEAFACTNPLLLLSSSVYETLSSSTERVGDHTIVTDTRTLVRILAGGREDEETVLYRIETVIDANGKTISSSVSVIRGGVPTTVIESNAGGGEKLKVATEEAQKKKNDGGRIGYKAAKTLDGKPCIVKLWIPEDSLVAASRDGSMYHKMRASKAVPQAIWTYDWIYEFAGSEMMSAGDSASYFDPVISSSSTASTSSVPAVRNKLIQYREPRSEARAFIHASDFRYKVGEAIEIPDFRPDLNEVCVPGIHFHAAQEEAFNWHGVKKLTLGMIVNSEVMSCA
ncbi:Hypothetical protein UVM_LOCUS150 [uncultured virus]|nr:Hypothetical protein UVM_LOCUS150 [uncultured virus]